MVKKKNKKCIEKSCDEIAGTPWCTFLCKKHDEERKKRITENLEKLVRGDKCV